MRLTFSGVYYEEYNQQIETLQEADGALAEADAEIRSELENKAPHRAGVYFVKQPLFNIILMIMAILMSNSATSILWSMYCPSLRDTGVVSTATGFLTFIGYIASSISSTAFANSVATIGWGKLILVWALLMGIGVISIVPYLFPKRHKSHFEH